MLKRSLRFAIGPSLGVTLGHVIISRVMYPHLYNKTYPSILEHAGMCLIVGYIVSFLASLTIEWVKSKLDGDKDTMKI
ncbi:MAG TPA: hypothetical protein GX394_08695 [Clostridiales bacterium]|jgi:hypothetical protein|nr:hypothetical protein [Clostridiales bacterium]